MYLLIIHLYLFIIYYLLLFPLFIHLFVFIYLFIIIIYYLFIIYLLFIIVYLYLFVHKISIYLYLFIYYSLFIIIYLLFMVHLAIGLMSRLFAYGPGDRGSIPGQVMPKTQKMVLDAALICTQDFKVRIKGKVEQSREWSSALPTPRCSSYWKGSLQVTFD